MSFSELQQALKEKGLKVTPQRMLIFEAVHVLANHPTAEMITDYVRKTHANIAVGTVYKVLETLADNGLITKVQTESDSMRYDAIIEQHHHLHCAETDKIEDYFDPELNDLIENYFNQKKIPNFTIENFKLQIKGKFKNL